MALEETKSPTELPVTDWPESLLREKLSTIEGAQKVVNLSLKAIQEATRGKRDSDNEEPLFTEEYRKASEHFRFVINSLPIEVASISVRVKFPEIKGESKTNRDHELKELHHHLKQITSKDLVSEGGNVCFEFVVLPSSIPEELKGLSHGSEVRKLSHQVRETLMLDRSSELNVLVIKSYGAAEGEASIPYLKARKCRVPLAQIESIKLNQEQKPLTPWLERDGQGGWVVKQVES